MGAGKEMSQSKCFDKLKAGKQKLNYLKLLEFSCLKTERKCSCELKPQVVLYL